MRGPIFFTIAILSILCGNRSFAGTAESALITVGAVAGMAAVGDAAVSGWLGLELKDWKRKDVGSTLVLGNECGLVSEARLLGNNRFNYAFIALKNEADGPRVIKPQEVTFTFDSGLVRFGELPYRVSSVRLENRQMLAAAIPFPNKEDFGGARSIKVSVPIYDQNEAPICKLSVLFERDPSLPVDFKTAHLATSFDMAIGVGGNLARGGAMNDLASGGGGVAVDLLFYGFFRENHGIHLGISMDRFSNSNRTLFAPVTGDATLDPSAQASVVYLGYTYRHLFSEQLSGLYDVGPGIGIFSHAKSGSTDRATWYPFAVAQRLSLDYRFWRKSAGFWAGDYAFGVSLTDLWLPAASLGPVPASGHSLNWLLRLKVGY